MKLLQSFKILQNLAADLGPVLALFKKHSLLQKIKKSDNANGKFSISRNSDIEMRIHLKNVFLIDAIGQRWNIFLVTKIKKMEPVLIILRQFLFFLRIGQPQPLFCLILFFSTYSLQKKL